MILEIIDWTRYQEIIFFILQIIISPLIYFIVTTLFGIGVLFFISYYFEESHIKNILGETPERYASTILLVLLSLSLMVGYRFLARGFNANIIFYSIYLALFISTMTKVAYFINPSAGVEFFKIISSFVIGVLLLAPSKDISTYNQIELIPILFSMGLATFFMIRWRAKIKEIYRYYITKESRLITEMKQLMK